VGEVPVGEAVDLLGVVLDVYESRQGVWHREHMSWRWCLRALAARAVSRSTRPRSYKSGRNLSSVVHFRYLK
jgi:hypothetical protein